MEKYENGKISMHNFHCASSRRALLALGKIIKSIDYRNLFFSDFLLKN